MKIPESEYDSDWLISTPYTAFDCENQQLQNATIEYYKNIT